MSPSLIKKEEEKKGLNETDSLERPQLPSYGHVSSRASVGQLFLKVYSRIFLKAEIVKHY